MSVQVRSSDIRLQQPVALGCDNSNNSYVVLRDEKSDTLRMVPRKEIISAKKSNKIGIGDVVSHGLRNKRIRGTVLLIGSQEQCTQSVQIIERTRQVVEEIDTPDTIIDAMVDENEENLVLNGDPETNVDDVCEKASDDGSEHSTDDFDVFEEVQPRTEMQAQMKEGTSSIKTKKAKEVEHTNRNRSPLSVLSNTNDDLSCLNTESSITVKRKISPNDVSNTFPSNNKKIKHVGYVSMRDHSKIVSQLAAAEEENLVYQTTWMPRPVDKATIQYFIYIGKVLSNDPSVSGNEADEVANKNELMQKICSTLDMTESELAKCAGKTILSTARQIISKKYPNSTTVFADVDKEHIQAIADYSWLMHPMDKKANDFSKLRKAMGNVFATRKFSRKLNNSNVLVQHSTAEDG